MTVREPVLNPTPIAALRPTQMTVGLREVEIKRRDWRRKAEEAGQKAAEYLGNHMVPAVRGPKGRVYITDHHHLVRALFDEGVESVLVNITADLSSLEKESFWFNLDNRGWLHPFDADGKRVQYSDIPKSIGDLTDDPFRSLAGALRRAGGYAKDVTPFNEFLWADFLRRRMKRREVAENFETALEQAMEFARSQDAAYLPGWSGPLPD